jgi:hypothetical protein
MYVLLLFILWNHITFCLHHMSLTPHSVYIICHLHLIQYTSYVTYTSFCMHHMSHLILYTSYVTPHSVYIICHLHLILYTSYVTPHSVYIICHLHLILYTSYVRAPDNFQVQRVITPYFWKWCVFAYFFCTVVLSTSKKIAYMYTFKIMLDTSVIQ